MGFNSGLKGLIEENTLTASYIKVCTVIDLKYGELKWLEIFR